MILDERHSPWQTRPERRASIRWAGYVDDWDNLIKLVNAFNNENPDFDDFVRSFTQQQYSCFGLIVQTKHHCLAITDHIRSYPIYVIQSPDQLLLTTNTQTFNFQHHVDTQSLEATEEFLLCGYVLGNRTLFTNSFFLRAGEFLVINKSTDKQIVQRYFRYLPKTNKSVSSNLLVREFGERLDQVFERVCYRANKRPIWVPLSGGLDSRLILCKLIEHGYPNIMTFSYGLNHNYDMNRAKSVARELGVPWTHVPSKVQYLRKLYRSSKRKEYTSYAWGAHMTPVWLDFEALTCLIRDKTIQENAIIINGYSGDFLFGGHIPENLFYDPTVLNLIDNLIHKHCSHFKSRALDGAKERISNTIRDEFSSIFSENPGVEDLCAFYEYWDWQERQTKAVVNGQRLYDQLGFDWILPLWDKALVDFWLSVPLPLRLGQTLHIQYLKHYNFKHQFDTLRATDDLWPPIWKWVPWVAKAIELLAGTERKNEFYEAMYYYGFHRFQLGLFGLKTYRSTYRNLRRPYVVPLAAISQLEEHSLELPAGLFKN